MRFIALTVLASLVLAAPVAANLAEPLPDDVDAELLPSLREDVGRVLESVRYAVPTGSRQ